jgi:hypothetical protein
MCDPIALNDLWVLQQLVGSGELAEERHAGAEHDRCQVDTQLVDQIRLQACPAMVPALTETSRSPAAAWACAIAFSRPSVTKVNGASGYAQSAGGSCVNTNTASPTGGRPFQPLVRSNRRRPITPAPMFDHASRR